MIVLWWIWTLACLSVVSVAAVQILGSVKRWVPLAMAAMVLRLLYLPLNSQDIVGHSVQYLEVFNGQVPSIGDTTFYPALQIVWFLAGKLSFGWLDPRLVSAFFGVLSILWVSTFSETTETGDTVHIAWLPMLWLFVLPEHIFWSHSMYNVVFPFAMMVLSVRFAQNHRWYLLSAAMAMAVACRMETVLFWGMLLFYLPIWDGRVLVKSLIGTFISLLLLSSMNIPGEGEYWESIAHNWWLMTFYVSYAVALLVTLVVIRKPVVPLLGWGLLWLVGHHVALSTFNDFSSRHVLGTAIVVMLLWVQSLRSQTLNWMRYSLLIAIVFNGYRLWEYRGQMRVDDELFEDFIRSSGTSELPDLTVQQAQSRSCAWIVEMEPMSIHPTQIVRSHFNLLNPLEVDGLLAEYDCIDWCYTIQDWSWTELGVQDRASRIEQMFTWVPIAIVQAGETACLLRTMDLTERELNVEWEHVH